MKEEPMIEKILIATDGSESAHEALEFGLHLAAEQDARAFVVHVAPAFDVMPYANFGYVGPSVPHEFNEHDRESLRKRPSSRPRTASMSRRPCSRAGQPTRS
jgi:nucleotide-binding universal stress UspA family protein